jgi:hypothetical protein
MFRQRVLTPLLLREFAIFNQIGQDDLDQVFAGLITQPQLMGNLRKLKAWKGSRVKMAYTDW